MTEYLSAAEVAYANWCLTHRQVKDQGLLESAVGAPQQTLYGVEAYPQLLEKAGCLMRSLAANHPFHDGNKRTAWTAAQWFLRLNGFQLEVDDSEAADFVVSCVTDHHEVSEIAEWMADRLE